MTMASSVFGSTGVNCMPLSEICCEEELSGIPAVVLAGEEPFELGGAHAAKAAPPPTLTTASPPARRALRRENWSPKYGLLEEIGRASCRERVTRSVGDVAVERK